LIVQRLEKSNRIDLVLKVSEVDHE